MQRRAEKANVGYTKVRTSEMSVRFSLNKTHANYINTHHVMLPTVEGHKVSF